MNIAFDLALRGALLPAAVALGVTAVALVAARRSSIALEVGPAVGILLGFGAAFVALLGVPPGPPTEAVHWLGWACGPLAAVGVWDAVARARLSGMVALAARALPVALLAWLMPANMFAGLAERVWLEESPRHLGIASVCVLVLWAALDLVASRLGAAAYAVLLVLMTTAAAGVVALGQTALLAQLVGALAAAIGGAAVFVVLVPRPGTSLRAATPAVALLVGLGVASARHTAYLSEAAVGMVALAAVAAAVTTLRLGAGPVLLRQALPSLAALALLGGAAAVAPQPAEVPEPDTVEGELDYGYDTLDIESPTPSTAPQSDNDYDNMGDWRPPGSASP